LDLGVETFASNVATTPTISRGVSSSSTVKDDAPADRIFIWKVTSYESIADDHHLRRVRRVAGSKHTAAQQSDVHGAKVITPATV
jgi:hypothetical protein